MTAEHRKRFEELAQALGYHFVDLNHTSMECMKAAYNLALEDARIVTDRERKSVMGQYPEAQAHRIACENIYENIDDLKI